MTLEDREKRGMLKMRQDRLKKSVLWDALRSLMEETEMDKETMVDKGVNTEGACAVCVKRRTQSLIRP